MLVNLGSEPINKNNIFTVSANIYSEKVNGYIKHWDGGTFTNYDDAFKFWDSWEPSEDEICSIMKLQRERGDFSHHELEIGIYRDVEEDLAFTNRSLDIEHEAKE